MISCKHCIYTWNWSTNLRRHEKAKHNGENGLSSPMANNKHFGSGYNVDNISGVFDIRLKENFKLFVTGPSRCGKTVFVAKLLENIHAFSKLPPVSVLYIYKVWQPKYDDIKSLGVNFIEDNDNVVNNIKSSVSGQPMLVIFDDLIGSS